MNEVLLSLGVVQSIDSIMHFYLHNNNNGNLEKDDCIASNCPRKLN